MLAGALATRRVGSGTGSWGTKLELSEATTRAWRLRGDKKSRRTLAPETARSMVRVREPSSKRHSNDLDCFHDSEQRVAEAFGADVVSPLDAIAPRRVEAVWRGTG